MKSLFVYLTLLSVGMFVAVGLSQISETVAPPKTAVLTLKAIPDKETYLLNDRIMVKSEFRNLSGKVLCFPKPSQACEDAAPGFLITKGVPPGNPGEVDQFICHTDGGGAWPRAKLLLEIKQKWIKLAPGEKYVTDPADIPVDLRISGQWSLITTYHPPQGAFGPAEFKKYLDSAAKESGCLIPQGEVSAAPTTITVVQKTSKN